MLVAYELAPLKPEASPPKLLAVGIHACPINNLLASHYSASRPAMCFGVRIRRRKMGPHPIMTSNLAHIT